MKLYGDPGSTCTRKVLATLAEKGAEAEFVHVQLAKMEQKSPEHLARQPFGKVPALEDDGFRLFESRAIIRYLDEKLPGPKLVPADAKQRAKMDQWMSVEYSYFYTPAMRIIYEKLLWPMRGHKTDATVVEAMRKEVGNTLDVLDKQLATSPYLVGEQFTLADIGYMPYIEYLFATGDSDLITSRPHVAAWWKRISERPSWKKATGKA